MSPGYQYNSVYHRNFPLLFRSEKDGCQQHLDSTFKCKGRSLWSRVSSKRLIKSQQALAKSGQRATEGDKDSTSSRPKSQAKTRSALRNKPIISMENTPILEQTSNRESDQTTRSIVNNLKAMLVKKKHIRFKPRTPEREAARSPSRGPNPKAEEGTKVLRKRPTMTKRSFEPALRAG